MCGGRASDATDKAAPAFALRCNCAALPAQTGAAVPPNEHAQLCARLSVSVRQPMVQRSWRFAAECAGAPHVPCHGSMSCPGPPMRCFQHPATADAHNIEARHPRTRLLSRRHRARPSECHLHPYRREAKICTLSPPKASSATYTMPSTGQPSQCVPVRPACHPRHLTRRHGANMGRSRPSAPALSAAVVAAANNPLPPLC